jgi:hypothetical protein
MMKMIRFVILASIVLIGVSLTANKVYARELVYRSVTLTVLDAETKQPLEGIIVTVVNVGYYEIPFFVDAITDYSFHMYRYKTNADGIVEIPQFKYRVGGLHYLDSQSIIINLELKDKSMKKKEQADEYCLSIFYSEPDDDFFRLQPEYKAGYISCDIGTWDYKPFERGIPYITVIVRSYKAAARERDQTSFFTGHEEFTFYLERFVAP